MSIEFYEHPDYAKLKKIWQKSIDMFEGDHEKITEPEYMWRHYLELTGEQSAVKLLATRQLRTRYLNLTKIITTLWKSLFFKEAPVLDEKARKLLEMDDAITNIDGKGAGLVQFLKDQVLESLLLYGRPIILVDAPENPAINRAEEKGTGKRPFMELLSPLSVLDWEAAPGIPGHYKMMRHEYDRLAPRSSAAQKPVMERFCDVLDLYDGRCTQRRYKVKRDDKGIILRTPEGASTWELYKEFLLDFSRLPISTIDSDSWLKDVNEESLRVHNLRSSKDNIEQNQAYQRILIGASNLDANQIKALTENNIGIGPSDMVVNVINPVDTSALKESIQDAISNVFKVGLQQLRSLPVDSRAVQGADTISEEKENMYAAITSTLEDIEILFNDALSVWAMFKGIKDFDGKITLTKDITDEDITEFLSIWTATKDMILKVEGVEKAVARKVIQRLGLEEEEDLLTAVESTDFKEKPLARSLGSSLFDGMPKDKEMMNGSEEAANGTTQAV